MVSVGPSALSCVVPLRNIGLPAPDPTSTISKATRRGLNVDSIAALILVKQLWRKRNLSPRGWVILAATAPDRPPLRKRVLGLAVQYFLSLWQQVPTAVRDIHYPRTSTETRGSTSEQVRFKPPWWQPQYQAQVPGLYLKETCRGRTCRRYCPGIQQSARLKCQASGFM